MNRFLLLIALLTLSSCTLFDAGESPNTIRIVNRSSEPVWPMIFELEESHLIDLAIPSVAQFNENKVGVGQSIKVEVQNYTRGDDIFLVLWRTIPKDEEREYPFPDEAEIVVPDYETYQDSLLRLWRYTIVVQD